MKLQILLILSILNFSTFTYSMEPVKKSTIEEVKSWAKENRRELIDFSRGIIGGIVYCRLLESIYIQEIFGESNKSLKDIIFSKAKDSSLENKKNLVHLLCLANVLAPEKGIHNRIISTITGCLLYVGIRFYQVINKT